MRARRAGCCRGNLYERISSERPPPSPSMAPGGRARASAELGVVDWCPQALTVVALALDGTCLKQLSTTVSSIVAAHNLTHARVSMAARSASHNAPLLALDNQGFCNPASNNKLLTASTVLHTFAFNDTFTTRIRWVSNAQSPDYGQVCLIGSFDPTVTDATLHNWALRVRGTSLGAGSREQRAGRR